MKIQPTLPAPNLSFQPGDPRKFRQLSLLYRLGKERRGETGVHRDQDPGVFHQQQVKGGAAVRSRVGDQMTLPPRGEEFRQATGVGEMGRHRATVYRHQDAEAVLALQEAARYRKG